MMKFFFLFFHSADVCVCYCWRAINDWKHLARTRKIGKLVWLRRQRRCDVSKARERFERKTTNCLFVPRWFFYLRWSRSCVAGFQPVNLHKREREKNKSKVSFGGFVVEIKKNIFNKFCWYEKKIGKIPRRGHLNFKIISIYLASLLYRLPQPPHEFDIGKFIAINLFI